MTILKESEDMQLKGMAGDIILLFQQQAQGRDAMDEDA